MHYSKKLCITFTRSYYTGPGNSWTCHFILASTTSASFGFSFNELFFISVLFSCTQLPLQWNWNGYRSQSTKGNVYDLHISRAHHLTCLRSSWVQMPKRASNKTDSWGTPELRTERQSALTTHWMCLSGKSARHFSVLLWIPLLLSNKKVQSHDQLC